MLQKCFESVTDQYIHLIALGKVILAVKFPVKSPNKYNTNNNRKTERSLRMREGGDQDNEERRHGHVLLSCHILFKAVEIILKPTYPDKEESVAFCV